MVNKAQAFEQGLKMYDSELVCKNGHIGKRYTSNGACVDCRTEKRDSFKQNYVARRIADNKGFKVVSLTVPPQHEAELVAYAEQLCNNVTASAVKDFVYVGPRDEDGDATAAGKWVERHEAHRYNQLTGRLIV